MSLATFADTLTLVATLLLAYPALRFSFLLKKKDDVQVAVGRDGVPLNLQNYAEKWRERFAGSMRRWNRVDHWCLCLGAALAVFSALIKLLI